MPGLASCSASAPLPSDHPGSSSLRRQEGNAINNVPLRQRHGVTCFAGYIMGFINRLIYFPACAPGASSDGGEGERWRVGGR